MTDTTSKPLSRSDKMKEVAYRRSLAKISPATLDRIQQEAAKMAIAIYEQKHGLGEFKPKISSGVESQPERPPDYEELAGYLDTMWTRLKLAFRNTKIEARKQKYDMVRFHLEAARRYLDKTNVD